MSGVDGILYLTAQAVIDACNLGLVARTLGLIYQLSEMSFNSVRGKHREGHVYGDNGFFNHEDSAGDTLVPNAEFKLNYVTDDYRQWLLHFGCEDPTLRFNFPGANVPYLQFMSKYDDLC